jgi:photosystem II stability/assembly factor-like uncharacterized protein
MNDRRAGVNVPFSDLTMRGEKRTTMRCCLQAILAAGACAASALGTEWTFVGPMPLTAGPYTGRISALASSATNPDLYYIGAATGGVWRTADGGENWTPLTDHLPTCAIGALAVDPDDDLIVYAGSGEANFAQHSPYGLGLYKTVDGGKNWTVLAAQTFAGRTFSRLVVSPADGNVLYAAVTRAGGFPALAAAKGHPLAEGPVGVFRSQDAGESWTLLEGGLPAAPASDLVVDPASPSTLYAAIADIFGASANGIYKSTDEGRTWAPLVAGLPPNPGRISLAVGSSDTQRLYALICNPASPSGLDATTLDVFRSDNGGATWSPTGLSPIQSTYGWYLSTVIVDPADPDNFFAGGVHLLRSANGGGTYAFVSPPHVDMHALAYDAAGRLLCGDDGGVHRSANHGQTWTALNNKLGAVQFYPGLSVHPVNPHFIIGGTQDNGTNLRAQPGLGWSHVTSGDGGFTAVWHENPQVLFAELQGTGSLFRSANGGQTFMHSAQGIDTKDRNCFLPPYVFLPGGSGRMLYATHRIYLSENAGQSWTPVSDDLTAGPPAAIRTLAPAPSDAQVVYAATNDGRILVSEDGGSHWALRLTDIEGWPRVTRELAVDRHDARRAVLAVGRFGGQQVRMTSDAGRSWTAIAGDLPDVPANTVAVHNPGFGRFILAGTDDGVYATCDDGARWRRFGTHLPSSPVVDLIVDLDHRRVLAATLGRGAWTVTLPALFDDDSSGTVDLRDLAALQTCFSGPIHSPGFVPPSEDCLVAFDLNADGAIDLQDHSCGVHYLESSGP